jgi:plasmid stabilization system protein ParE
MNFLVRTTPRAERDIEVIHRWILETGRRPAEAWNWAEGMRESIASLAAHPARCPIAPEARILGQDVRQLFFHSHRVLFLVREDDVAILHIRHASRLPATPEELLP